MRDKENLGLIFLKLVFLIAIAIVIEPFIIFWFAYFGGWIAKLTIGNILCKSLTLIGINIIPNQIPLLAGCLSWVGSFFRSIGNLGKYKER